MLAFDQHLMAGCICDEMGVTGVETRIAYNHAENGGTAAAS